MISDAPKLQGPVRDRDAPQGEMRIRARPRAVHEGPGPARGHQVPKNKAAGRLGSQGGGGGEGPEKAQLEAPRDWAAPAVGRAALGASGSVPASPTEGALSTAAGPSPDGCVPGDAPVASVATSRLGGPDGGAHPAQDSPATSPCHRGPFAPTRPPPPTGTRSGGVCRVAVWHECGDGENGRRGGGARDV